MKCYDVNGKIIFVEPSPIVEKRMKRFIKFLWKLPVYFLAAYLFIQGVCFVFHKGVDVIFEHYNLCHCRTYAER